MDLDPRTVGGAELSIAERQRELSLIHEPDDVFVRVVAPSKHLDRLRDQSDLDPFTDQVSLSIHRGGDRRDGCVRGLYPPLSFNIRLCTFGRGRWSRPSRIIADVDEVVQHTSFSVHPPPPGLVFGDDDLLTAPDLTFPIPKRQSELGPLQDAPSSPNDIAGSDNENQELVAVLEMSRSAPGMDKLWQHIKEESQSLPVCDFSDDEV